jgi:hypothetical protein
MGAIVDSPKRVDYQQIKDSFVCDLLIAQI